MRINFQIFSTSSLFCDTLYKKKNLEVQMHLKNQSISLKIYIIDRESMQTFLNPARTKISNTRYFLPTKIKELLSRQEKKNKLFNTNISVSIKVNTLANNL